MTAVSAVVAVVAVASVIVFVDALLVSPMPSVTGVVLPRMIM